MLRSMGHTVSVSSPRTLALVPDCAIKAEHALDTERIPNDRRIQCQYLTRNWQYVAAHYQPSAKSWNLLSRFRMSSDCPRQRASKNSCGGMPRCTETGCTTSSI